METYNRSRSVLGSDHLMNQEIGPDDIGLGLTLPKVTLEEVK
jgi:hypothetical protein